MRVSFICGTSVADLESKLNDFLKTVEGVTDIKYDLENTMTAIVAYTPAGRNELCCDCRAWDDNGDNLIGLCHKRGGRKRFSDKACEDFDDRR